MKPDTSKKLSFHKCLSDSHETLQEDVPEIKSSLSGNISNFMKINQLRLSMDKRHKTSPPGSSIIKNEFGINSEHFPEDFLNEYHFIKKIDKGMQGQVFQIREIQTNIDYAAKIYETADEEKISMIKNEAQILSSISHPNIIQFKKFYCRDKENLFIIINELFPSISLEKLITSRSLLPHEKSFMAKTIINIVVYLQENNITHGDFNLSNILVNPDTLQIKLIDFGLSKQRTIQNEFQSPKGFLIYRPPQEFQMFYQSEIYDIWGLLLVLMSIFLEKKICSKSLLKLLGEIEDNSQGNEETFMITKYMKGVFSNEKKDETLKQSVYILKDILYRLC